jgi:hypothetical protein
MNSRKTSTSSSVMCVSGRPILSLVPFLANNSLTESTSSGKSVWSNSLSVGPMYRTASKSARSTQDSRFSPYLPVRVRARTRSCRCSSRLLIEHREDRADSETTGSRQIEVQREHVSIHSANFVLANPGADR